MKKNILNDKKDLTVQYVWPLSAGLKPDLVSFPFGPGIKNNKWYFHNGIDIPANVGSKVHAVCSGKVYRIVTATDKLGYESIVIQTDPEADKPISIFIRYLHLQVQKNLEIGKHIQRGQLLGTLEKSNTSSPYLHLEFRAGNFEKGSSLHPLNYLPYHSDVKSFSILDCKIQKNNHADRKVRFSFTIQDKQISILRKIEVSLLENNSPIGKTKIIDLEDENTINKNSIDDHELILNSELVGIEGYQSSDSGNVYNNLIYGVIIDKIPTKCNDINIKVIGVGENILLNSTISLDNPTKIYQFLDFEDGLMPPNDWRTITTMKGVCRYHQPGSTHRTTVSNEKISSMEGKRVMLNKVNRIQKSTANAALEYDLSKFDYFELLIEAMINPTNLRFYEDGNIYPICLLDKNNNLIVSSKLYQDKDNFRACLTTGSMNHSSNENGLNTIALNKWEKWILKLLRINTRETTAVLYLSEKNNQPIEISRLNYDSSSTLFTKLRLGMGLCTRGTYGTMYVDDIRLTSVIN